MLRRQYQEKYFGNKNYEIKEIESEFSLVSELFTELNNEVNRNSKNIDVIEDYIERTQNEVKEEGEKLLIESNVLEFNIFKKRVLGGFIGAGLGSLMILYNPYIAIATTISGGLSGYFIAK